MFRSRCSSLKDRTFCRTNTATKSSPPAADSIRRKMDDISPRAATEAARNRNRRCEISLRPAYFGKAASPSVRNPNGATDITP